MKKLVFKVLCGLVVLSGLSVPAQAGTLLEAMLAGQAQQQMAGSDISACGFSLVAVEVPTVPATGRAFVFNGSVMVYGPEGGFVKVRVSDLDAKAVATNNFDMSKLRFIETAYVWLKAPGEKATEPSPNTTVTASEDPGYKLYVSSMESTFALIDAIIDDKIIQIGFKTKTGNVEQVLYGKVAVTDSQRNQATQCLGEWSANMKKKYKLQ